MAAWVLGTVEVLSFSGRWWGVLVQDCVAAGGEGAVETVLGCGFGSYLLDQGANLGLLLFWCKIIPAREWGEV